MLYLYVQLEGGNGLPQTENEETPSEKSNAEKKDKVDEEIVSLIIILERGPAQHPPKMKRIHCKFAKTFCLGSIQTQLEY
jgi:hypothetical protein